MVNYKIYVDNLALIYLVFLLTAFQELVTNHGWINFVLTYIWLPLLASLIIFLDIKISKIKKIKWQKFSIDKVGLLILIIITFVSLPWFFAIVNGDINKVPLVNSVFLFPNHTGMHHGYSGWFTLLSVILLFPFIKEVRNKFLKRMSLFLLLVLFIIGFQNLLDDFIIEQLEPRFGIKSPFEIFHSRN